MHGHVYIDLIFILMFYLDILYVEPEITNCYNGRIHLRNLSDYQKQNSYRCIFVSRGPRLFLTEPFVGPNIITTFHPISDNTGCLCLENMNDNTWDLKAGKKILK